MTNISTVDCIEWLDEQENRFKSMKERREQFAPLQKLDDGIVNYNNYIIAIRAQLIAAQLVVAEPFSFGLTGKEQTAIDALKAACGDTP